MTQEITPAMIEGLRAKLKALPVSAVNATLSDQSLDIILAAVANHLAMHSAHIPAEGEDVVERATRSDGALCARCEKPYSDHRRTKDVGGICPTEKYGFYVAAQQPTSPTPRDTLAPALKNARDWIAYQAPKDAPDRDLALADADAALTPKPTTERETEPYSDDHLGIDKPHSETDREALLPYVRGIARAADQSDNGRRTLTLHFEREPTDDEMQAIQDALNTRASSASQKG